MVGRNSAKRVILKHEIKENNEEESDVEEQNTLRISNISN